MDAEIRTSRSFYGWKNVTLGVILGFSMALVFYTFTLFLPFWVDEFGWSRQSISYAATLFSIIMGLNYIFVGHFIVLLVIALVCLIFAKPPKHPSLREGSDTRKLIPSAKNSRFYNH